MDRNEEELRHVMTQLGEFGRYQLKQHLLHSLAWLLSAAHMMSFVFVFPVLEHRCFIEDVDNGNASNALNNNIEDFIPKTFKGKLESCVRFDLNETYNDSAVLTTCERYTYNSSYFQSSRITDWDMVCGNKWKRALLQSIYLGGTLVGSFVSGSLSDRFGRKPVFYICGILQCVCGVLGAFLSSYVPFAISFFLYGMFGSGGSNVASVALTMEIVGASKRSVCGTMFTMWFNLGSLLVAAWAYLLNQFPWKIFSAVSVAGHLQLIIALHSVILFGHWWFMDESICWLFANGERGKALAIAEKAIKFNGKEFKPFCPKKLDAENEVHGTPENSSDPYKSRSAFDLLRFPQLRQRTLVMLYCWFAASLIYYGLSFNSVNLLGNPYLMFVMSVLAEIPAHLICLFIVPKVGNKAMCALSLLLAGVLCVATVALSSGILATSIIMIAKVTITVAINIVNSYTAELFPTVLRNTAIGFSVMAGRGGIAAVPQINLLSAAGETIPTATFGTSGILAGIFVLFMLPETMDRPIPQTIEDVERPCKEESEAEGKNNNFLALCSVLK